MTPRILKHGSNGLFLPGLLLLMSIPWIQGCASMAPPLEAPPSEAPIKAEITTVPEGIEMTYRGKVLGRAPFEMDLDHLAAVVELGTTFEEPPIIERRIKVLDAKRVQILIRIGTAPSAVAKALGLTRVVVFDYGAFTTFDVDDYKLKSEVLPLLRQQAKVLEEHFGELDIYVCGHTDSTGGGDHNQVLAVNRAQAVADFLTALGLSAKRMRVQGLGAEYPIADNATSEGRRLNRRTEIVLPDS